MTSNFEDLFSELQTDIISLCFEYADGKVNDIYTYCSIEEGIYAFDVFFGIHGSLYQKQNLNDANLPRHYHKYDTSPERQSALLETGIEDLKRLKALLEKYDRPTPTELKLHYNIDTGRLSAEYKYEPVYTNHKTLTSEDIFDNWFDQIKEQTQLDS